jgi:hypothetical protein
MLTNIQISLVPKRELINGVSLAYLQLDYPIHMQFNRKEIAYAINIKAMINGNKI